MAALHSEAEMEQELYTMLSTNRNGPDKEVTLENHFIEDYARIGSLMSDQAACVSHLARLNTILVNLAEMNNIRKRGSVFGGKKNKLVTETFTYRSETGQTVSGTVRKHGNILKRYLDLWEVTQGFNEGSHEEGGLPDRAPLLTGFVQPPDFRKYLLKHGYHWTDIGVAEKHGEFTHRLHWYIICEQANGDPTWLNNTPLELFKKCADESTVNGGANSGSIWDRIFDHLGKEAYDGPKKGTAVVFRKAETLHAFLLNEATRKRKDLWALAQIVHSRAARVGIINSLGGDGGARRLDLDLESRQDAQSDDLLLKGDITAKILWQKIQEDDAGPMLNEFLQ